MRALDYTLKAYKKLFPTIVISVGALYIAYYLRGYISAGDLPYIIYEIFCLPMSGIYKMFIDLPLWYLSAYLICLPAFVYLLDRHRDFFYEVGGVLFPLLIYGYICRKNIFVDIWMFESGIWFISLFRAFAGLCMGMCCFRASKFFAKLKWRKGVKNAVLILLFVVVIRYMYAIGYTYADYFCIFLIMLMLAIIFSCDSVLGNGSKWATFLGKWSTAIYCSHWLIRDVVAWFFSDRDAFETLPFYFLAALIYGLFVLWLSGVMSKYIEKTKKKVFYDTEI